MTKSFQASLLEAAVKRYLHLLQIPPSPTQTLDAFALNSQGYVVVRAPVVGGDVPTLSLKVYSNTGEFVGVTYVNDAVGKDQQRRRPYGFVSCPGPSRGVSTTAKPQRQHA